MPSTDPSRAWTAIVLAAGQGRRLGGVAKPWIRLNGLTLLERWITHLRAAQASRIILVTRVGAHADATARQHPDLCWCEAPPHDNPMHSLRVGLQHVHDPTHSVMVCLADQPFITPVQLTALKHAYEARPHDTDMVVPWVAQQPGNPVCLAPALAHQWRTTPIQAMGKAWREQHPERVHWWHNDDTHYLIDIDTPEDVRQLQRHGLTVTLPNGPLAAPL